MMLTVASILECAPNAEELLHGGVAQRSRTENLAQQFLLLCRSVYLFCLFSVSLVRILRCLWQLRCTWSSVRGNPGVPSTRSLETAPALTLTSFSPIPAELQKSSNLRLDLPASRRGLVYTPWRLNSDCGRLDMFGAHAETSTCLRHCGFFAYHGLTWPTMTSLLTV